MPLRETWCVETITSATTDPNTNVPGFRASKVEDEQRHLGALEDSFQQIKNTTGLAGVDDIIER